MTYTAEDTHRFVQAGNVRIHFHEAGTGFPLVLFHGGGPGGSGWSNFNRNVDELAKNWRVLIVDLPGYGKSDLSLPSGEVLGYLAGVMRDFLDALDIKKAHVVGNSLGGGTALKLALDYPDRVAGLILMGPGGTLPVFTPMPTEGIRRLFEFYTGDGPSEQKLRDFINMLVFDPTQITDELFKERYEAATQPEIVANPPLKWQGKPPLEDLWRERIDQLPHEVLLIHGREDRVVPMDSAFLMLKQIPNARLHVVPRCGHWVQWEAAAEFNYLTDNFCASVATS